MKTAINFNKTFISLFALAGSIYTALGFALAVND
jgi:hypothetical protein